jgi:hypothetical protein
VAPAPDRVDNAVVHVRLAPVLLAIAALATTLGACSALVDLGGLSEGGGGRDAALDSSSSAADGGGGGSGGGGHDASFGDAADAQGGLDAQDAPEAPPPADPFVQVAFNSQPSSCIFQASTATVALTKPQIAGDLNVVAIGWFDVSATVASVTDSSNNKYLLAIGPTQSHSGSTISQALYYAPSIVAAASNVVSVTFAGSADTPDVRVLEYSGYGTLDQTSGASGTTTTPSAALMTQFADELVVGAVTTLGSFVSASPGDGVYVDPCGNFAIDQVVPGAQAVTMSATIAPFAMDSTWVMSVASFR